MTFEDEALAALGLEPEFMHEKPQSVHDAANCANAQMRKYANMHKTLREAGTGVPVRFLRGRKVATIQAKRRAALDGREKAVARTIARVVGRWQTRFLAACKLRRLLERGSDIFGQDAMHDGYAFMHRLREVGPYKKPLPPPNRLPSPPDVPPGFIAAANAAFDPQELEDALIDAMEVELLLGQNAAADDAELDGIGAELRWDVVPARAIATYRAAAADFADSVVGDDRDALMATIENALQAGTSPKALANDITTFFGEGVHRVARDGTLFTHATDDWALLVGRTELARAYNAGARDLYAAAGYTKWLWLAAHDERQCEYCDQADGTVLPIGENFPGVDVDQPPAHPNCLCVMVADPDAIDKLGGAEPGDDDEPDEDA